MKKEYKFYHDENEGYVLVDAENGDILMDIPISESEEITRKIRSDVKNYLKENNQSGVVRDGFDESRIEFENGEVIGGYSRYEGFDKEALELWGFGGSEMKKCPVCKVNDLNEEEVMNPLSRKDNKTHICGECAFNEAMEEQYEL